MVDKSSYLVRSTTSTGGSHYRAILIDGDMTSYNSKDWRNDGDDDGDALRRSMYPFTSFAVETYHWNDDNDGDDALRRRSHSIFRTRGRATWEKWAGAFRALDCVQRNVSR